MKKYINLNYRKIKESANYESFNFTRMYDLTREAFIMALTEFINGEIWRD